MADREINFDDLVGQEFDFYGCDEQRFKLDDQVYEVIDGDLPGLNSTQLDHIELCENKGSFCAMPIARVVVEEDCEEVYTLVDLHDGHEWLRFGTEHTDYYSDRMYTFVFEYTPRSI